MRKAYALPLLCLSHCAAAWLGFNFATSYSPRITPIEVPGAGLLDRVLDGDTIVRNGKAFHVLGVDAPELGPWANCWAEAALAGHSKDQLESVLLRGSWRAVESRAAGSTIDSVELIRADGETARDLMVVGGYAAETETRWDWCKSSVGKDQESGDEPAPHGPNLWWPSGPVFDPRAND